MVLGLYCVFLMVLVLDGLVKLLFYNYRIVLVHLLVLQVLYCQSVLLLLFFHQFPEIRRFQGIARERLEKNESVDCTEMEETVKGLTDLRLQKYDELMAGLIDSDEFVSIWDVIGEKLEEAEAELGRLKALEKDRERMEGILRPLVELEGLTIDGLRMVAESVLVDEDGVRVKLKGREFLEV